ncbi:NADPH-dependent 7-cyano-7-deazaguanine reductase QueF [Desulfovibrio mangrovi]|uniref:NADPH-dependent 7-cyano-7-deazaguanine reductase QueF n=1 Tax=Desulfovibrio mangrovi TaxID=2976983 RepID=UPI0022471A73|nr:NADPH-dependent 7-cyano-7-deazaguanine reductase QueF [Desulfovibrio mangrovi]UZP66998.1 NADPH-dependent 7-cyano-7-deazaguanine reductase QueF [Desulfovibrio mangrovi]
MSVMDSDKLVLGRQVDYSLQYDPKQLCPIPRELGRTAAGIHTALLRHGEDIWNIYELSWLAPSGLPVVGMAVVRVPWQAPFLIESKSLKLYCNSFNMTRFDSAAAVREAMERDLSEASGAPVTVDLLEPHRFSEVVIAEPNGVCVEEVADFASAQGTADFVYDIDPSLLKVTDESAREILFSRLFRSRCPVTGQPDWATVRVVYAGPRIDPEGLMRYLVSYRSHQGFHEACVERIYGDILTHCRPDELEVSARFTRRGGIDINPVRSTHDGVWDNLRDPRQ